MFLFISVPARLCCIIGKVTEFIQICVSDSVCSVSVFTKLRKNNLVSGYLAKINSVCKTQNFSFNFYLNIFSVLFRHDLLYFFYFAERNFRIGAKRSVTGHKTTFLA